LQEGTGRGQSSDADGNTCARSRRLPKQASPDELRYIHDANTWNRTCAGTPGTNRVSALPKAAGLARGTHEHSTGHCDHTGRSRQYRRLKRAATRMRCSLPRQRGPMHSTAWQHCHQSWHCPRTSHPVEQQQQQQQHTHPPSLFGTFVALQWRRMPIPPSELILCSLCTATCQGHLSQTLHQRPMHSTRAATSTQPLKGASCCSEHNQNSILGSMVPQTLLKLTEAGLAFASCPAQVQICRVPAPEAAILTMMQSALLPCSKPCSRSSS
jgi:hypothetical protein